MSEKLFFRLYWRPYVLLGVSLLLVLISSLAPYVLPHAWLDKHIPGYLFYMFKVMAWLVKIAMILVLVSLVRAFTADYFPKLEELCTKRTTGSVAGYKKTWDRYNQLRPIISYKVEKNEYSCAISEAKGRRKKGEDIIDSNYSVGLKKNLIYNYQKPEIFYIPGEEIYSRKAAIVRYVLLLLLLLVEAYMGIFHYMLG